MGVKCMRIGCMDTVVAKQLCAKHQPKSASVVHRNRADYHKLYSTKGWQALRRKVLSNTPLCERCSTDDSPTIATDVDHVQPHKGDTKLFYNSNNLQALCHRCHSYKTNKEMKGVIEDYRTRRPQSHS